jgi:hypothetical protein
MIATRNPMDMVTARGLAACSHGGLPRWRSGRQVAAGAPAVWTAPTLLTELVEPRGIEPLTS